MLWEQLKQISVFELITDEQSQSKEINFQEYLKPPIHKIAPGWWEDY